MQLFLEIFSRMANSVDPDQTAPSSGSTLFAYAILSDTLVNEILEHLPYYQVVKCQTCLIFMHTTPKKLERDIACGSFICPSIHLSSISCEQDTFITTGI